MQFNPARDRFKWVAHYKDGSKTEQIEADGKKNGYGDIRRPMLASFELIRKHDLSRALLVKFNPGEQLIWRRRVDIIEGRAVHIVGKRNSERQWIAVLFPDDTVEFAEKWNEDSSWLYEPQLREGEGESE